MTVIKYTAFITFVALPTAISLGLVNQDDIAWAKKEAIAATKAGFEYGRGVLNRFRTRS